MRVTDLFIRRPVTTTLIMLGILGFGIMAYRFLPVSDLPTVDFPTIQVSATYPGASPQTMAATVATPLERQFTTIAGLDSMTSSSNLGGTQITLQFNLSRNIDAAAQDVQAAIARAARQLPPDLPSPPSYQKVNPADQPVVYIALTSPTLPLYSLNEYAETMMAQNISTVSGVAQVLVYGSQKYAVRVQLDPQKLAAMQLGLDEVAQAVQQANVNLPTGALQGAHTAYTVQATGQLQDAAAYRPVIVAYRNGNPVRLSQLGRVIDSVENDMTAAWYIDQRAVVLAVQRQPGTNTVAVVDAVRKLLPSFQKLLPGSVTMSVLYDRSQSIRESVADVKFTLVLAIALVVAVIFIFLRNLRATIIPSIAIPMSLVGTFVVMYLMGYSVDNLSLMALTLAIGFVVDDAIVMLENIVRHMELGRPRFAAALEGASEITFTIISMTLSLAAVFLPVLFMGGILGRLLNEFSVTIAAAILISGAVSLSLTPMLCSRFLASAHAPADQPPAGRGGDPEAHRHSPQPHQGAPRRHGRLYQAFERLFDAMLEAYKAGLRVVLRRRLATMAVSAAVLAATIWLFATMPKGFLPNEDTGQIFALTEAAEGVSFEALAERQKAVAEIVRQHPAVESFMSSVGARGGITGTNSGVMFIRLKDSDHRSESADQVIQDLRPRVAQVPGIRVFMQNPPPIRIGGQLTRSQYSFTLQSPDTDALYQHAPALAEQVRALPGFQDVSTDLRLRTPQANVEIDRDRASTLGVSAQQIELALSSAFGSRQISTILAPNNQYPVIIELEKRYQRDPEALSRLYVRSSRGDLVPLPAVARITRGVGPLSVNHVGQLPAVTVSFNLAPGVSLGDAVNRIEQLAGRTLPATVSVSFQGQAQAFQSSLTGLGLLMMMAILVIYLVLGILYESFIHPLTILSALPFAGFGALVTLLLFGADLSLYAFVGVIMLVGLVKKNGIMMIDFAIAAQRDQGRPPEQAIFEACVVRFRPIMMTTMAALMGTLPIALGYGAGAQARRPLGLAVVGGLLFSQLLTLFVTPVFYLYMEKLRHAFSPRRATAPPERRVEAPARMGDGNGQE